jgi:RNA polymerase sigma-70 factor (ECF subfamily)
MTIARLLQRSQAGDTLAAQSLVLTFQADLLRLAGAILDDPAEAEEAVQDALLIALRSLSEFRGDSAFKTWLFTIAINECRRRLRKRQARERLQRALQSIFRLSGEGPTHPEDLLIQGETQTAVRRAVAALSEKHRLPIVLFYDNEMPVAEIAQTLDLPVGTVLSRLHSAREKLRFALQSALRTEPEGSRNDGNHD